jgi:topoisomerase-4 subunit B
VRKREQTIYCYSEEERLSALEKLGVNPEITRFKGLGEMSPDEFKTFIGPEMRLDPVMISKDSGIKDLLTFYMGKNTDERRDFIIENLVGVDV